MYATNVNHMSLTPLRILSVNLCIALSGIFLFKGFFISFLLLLRLLLFFLRLISVAHITSPLFVLTSGLSQVYQTYLTYVVSLPDD
jgi:hypothetical protein